MVFNSWHYYFYGNYDYDEQTRRSRHCNCSWVPFFVPDFANLLLACWFCWSVCALTLQQTSFVRKNFLPSTVAHLLTLHCICLVCPNSVDLCALPCNWEFSWASKRKVSVISCYDFLRLFFLPLHIRAHVGLGSGCILPPFRTHKHPKHPNIPIKTIAINNLLLRLRLPEFANPSRVPTFSSVKVIPKKILASDSFEDVANMQRSVLSSKEGPTMMVSKSHPTSGTDVRRG